MGYFLAANILLKTREEILHKTYLSSEIILDEIQLKCILRRFRYVKFLISLKTFLMYYVGIELRIKKTFCKRSLIEQILGLVVFSVVAICKAVYKLHEFLRMPGRPAVIHQNFEINFDQVGKHHQRSLQFWVFSVQMLSLMLLLILLLLS